MKKSLTLALCLLFGLTSYTCAADPSEWRANQKKQEALAKEQLEKIKPEIEKLEAHPWAGHYTTGSGLSGEVLYIAPDAGFALHDWADIFSFWYRGQCTHENGVIKLTYAPTGEEAGAKFVPRELIHVRWGERSYLLSDALVGSPKNFCKWIVLGYEPHHGSSLLREGDREKPVEGLPEFPEGYEKYAELLRKHIIDAKILEVGKTAVKPRWGGGVEYRVEVTIDKGEDAGVLPDTKYVNGNLVLHGRLLFSEVGPTQAKGILEFTLGRKENIMEDGKNTLIVPGKQLLMAKESAREAFETPRIEIIDEETSP